MKNSKTAKKNNVNTRKIKIYRLYAMEVAIDLLRPEAKWEWSSNFKPGSFTRWDDPRPQPTKEEIDQMMEKIKAFEDSIDNTIWTKEQLIKYTGSFEE